MAEPAKIIKPENADEAAPKARLRVVPTDPKELELFLKEKEGIKTTAELETEIKGTETSNVIPLFKPGGRIRTITNPNDNTNAGSSGDASGGENTKSKLDDEDSGQVYETSGSEPSKVSGERAKNSSEAVSKDTPSSSDLANSEKSGGDSSEETTSKKKETVTQGYENQVGEGYKTDRGGKQKLRGKTLKGWAYRHQKKLFGGGIITIIVGLFFMFTLASGPLQFMHFSQLLQQFHFGSLQDTQDSRFLKQVRFWRFASQGQVENSRLSLVGRKVAPKFEAKLNASGFKSTYSTTFGNFNGYEIDRSNEKFKGKTISQIRKIVKEQYGLDVVGPEGLGLSMAEAKDGLFIDARKLGSLDTHRLNYALLRETGYSRLAAAIGSRTLCNKAGCTMHPLKKLTVSLSRAAEEKFYAKERAKQISRASEAAKIRATAKEDKNNPAAAQASASQAAGANSVINEGTNTAQAVRDGDTKAIGAQKDRIASILKPGGATLAVGGLLCVLQGINDSYTAGKKTQVENPAVNTAFSPIGTDGQIRSGQDVNTRQLSYNSKFLSGTDSTGKQSSWINAETFQTQLGHPGQGVPADDTLKLIGKDSVPFPDLESASLSSFCSVVNSPFGIAISFIGSGVFQIASGIAQSIIASQFIDRAAHWLSSSAIDPYAVGADLGNIANYGAHLANVWQFASAGGVVLDSATAQKQADENQVAVNDDLSRKGLLYRIFNTSDANTAAGKFIDQQNPDPVKNIARMGSNLLDFKHMFSSVGNFFTKPAKAASDNVYDYGLPSYGFTDDELYGDVGQAIPTENAYAVANILDRKDSASKAYIQKAKDCFGVAIELIPTTSEDGTVNKLAWGVNSRKDTLIDVDKRTANCQDSSNQDWLKIRFFILDNVTMDNMACYQGDGESCNNIGVSTTDSSSSSTSGGSTPTGDGTGGCSLSAPAYGTQNGIGNNYTEQQLRTIFGDPGTATSHTIMDANLTNVDFLGYNAQVHKLAAPCLRAVAQDIQASGTTYKIREFGCYRYDSNNGSSNIGAKSYHTYGVACDINWSTNPFIDSTNLSPPCNPDPSKYDIPQEIITAFHNHGWTWGGNWCSVKDYMHFEFNGIAP